jgi:surfactin synthase thioesterase subunit
MFQARNVIAPAGLVCFSAMAPDEVARDRLWEGLSEAELARRLLELGGLSEAVRRREAGLRQALPAIEADLHCYGQYATRDAAPLTCPVLAFRGVDDPLLRASHVEAWRAEVAPEHLESTRVLHVPGGHFCHIGRRDLILSELVAWARDSGLLPEGFAFDSHQASRFVWRPLTEEKEHES